MKCPYCGYNNSDNSRFCSGCGKKLERETVEYNREQPEQNLNRQEPQGQPPYGQEQYRQRQQVPRQNVPSGKKPEKSGHSREEKKIIVIGIILACIVVVAGIGAYFGISHFLNKEEATASESQNRPEVTVTVTPEPATTQSASPSPTAAVTAQPTPTVTEAPEEVTAYLVDRSGVNLYGYSKASVKKAEASSVVEQEGIDNSAAMAVDGDEITSWQEGVDGDGIDEFLHLTLDRETNVKYLTFKLGNWRDQENYNKNNRPKTMTIWLDELSFTVTFADGKKEFCLELSQECEVSDVYVRIDSVYKGTEWDDTCIAEIGIYGK